MVEKTYKVVLANLAVERLKRIYVYYKEQNAVELGQKIKKGLLEESKILKKLPGSKVKLPTKKQAIPPLRYTKKWSYKIIFQVFENDDIVLIVDFLNDKESPEKWENL